MRYFAFSLLITAAGLSTAYYWGGLGGLLVASILSVMEISLSFDNAVVNASVLRNLSAVWQRRFLTWGMLIAVFGARFLLPILIVAAMTGHRLDEVIQMALRQPDEYARHLDDAHIRIAAFGGMYLLLVFFAFLFQTEKTLHWVVFLERRLSRLGKLESIEVVTALGALLAAQQFLPPAERTPALVAGITGVILFVLVKSLAALFGATEQAAGAVHRAGFLAFLYLEILDLSFSFDGVIGAFALSKDVVIIMLGLTIGAMFVRSLTVFLVRRRALEEYLFLEHGAHYAVGALAVLMLVDMVIEVPETLAGLTGMVFILLALISSVLYRRQLRRRADGAR